MNQLSLDSFVDSGVECPTCGRDDFETEHAMKTHHGASHGEPAPSSLHECDYCGGEFQRPPARSQSDHIFCDQDCQKAWESDNRSGEDAFAWKGRVEVECANCGAPKQIHPNRDDDRTHFCSRECRADYASKHWTGPDHSCWKGGYGLRVGVLRALDHEGWERRSSRIRERDNHTCQNCGCESSDGVAHDVHHLVPIRAGGTNGEWNLMTLCKSCHKQAESYIAEYMEFVLTPEYYQSD